jgi:hypothetical protein
VDFIILTIKSFFKKKYKTLKWKLIKFTNVNFT